MLSGYKGYGFGMICEIMTAILSGGTTSNYIYKTSGCSNIAQFFMAVDYGIFGNKEEIRSHMSGFIQEIRDSAKADGQDRIYVAGEKAAESKACVLAEGVSLNEKTYDEMKMVAAYTGAVDLLPAYMD